MKTTIIAIIALIMVSCKKETPQPECTCNEVYSRNSGSGWVVQSITPIDAECWKHNEITDEWNTTNSWSPILINHKKQIICE